MQTLPRGVQWSAAIGFMAIPLSTCTIALVANVVYAMQYGPAWVAVGILCSLGLIVLPIVATITGSWTTRAKILYVGAALFNALTALQLAADDRFAGMFTRSEAAAQYEANKVEIARMARELSLISESSTSAALKVQITALEAEITTQKSLIETHSDPKQQGPCKKTCEAYKLKLSAQQDQLGQLAERLGQATKRERLEAALQDSRAKWEEAAPPKKAGLSMILEYASSGHITEHQSNMVLLILMTGLYLAIIEIGSYLSGPAASAIMKVAMSKPQPKVTVEATFEPVTVAEAFPPVLDIPVEWTEPREEEQPAVERKPRKRRADGRFAKKPGPKPKLKLNALKRPTGANVVDLTTYKGGE